MGHFDRGGAGNYRNLGVEGKREVEIERWRWRCWRRGRRHTEKGVRDVEMGFEGA